MCAQAFTRHTNALVLDPRDLASVGGTMAKWGDGSNSGNNMQTTGRLQTLLTTAQLEECDRWRDEHIVPAVADAWVSRGAGKGRWGWISARGGGRAVSMQTISTPKRKKKSLSPSGILLRTSTHLLQLVEL